MNKVFCGFLLLVPFFVYGMEGSSQDDSKNKNLYIIVRKTKRDDYSYSYTIRPSDTNKGISLSVVSIHVDDDLKGAARRMAFAYPSSLLCIPRNPVSACTTRAIIRELVRLAAKPEGLKKYLRKWLGVS